MVIGMIIIIGYTVECQLSRRTLFILWITICVDMNIYTNVY